jgi:hypothetical protein
MSEEKIVTKDIKVAKMEQPKFLTLTKLPANQVAFKIVRGEDKEARKRTLRRAANPSLAVIFPADMGEDECKALMTEYGFDTYSLVAEGDGDDKRWKAYRSDIKPDAVPADALTIGIGEGMKLVIERKHTRRSGVKKEGIAVVAFEFNLDKYPEIGQIQDWLQRNAVDFAEDRLENSDTSVLYRRAEAPEKAEIGKVEVEAGVIAHVVRQEEMDVPSPVYDVISEAAFGSWGQLDFGAYLADVEYTSATHEAVEVLDRVLTEVLFYSYLPLSVRKELVARATAQFTSYVTELMDALPPKTVMINRSMKEQEMTKKDEGKSAEDIKRADDEAKAKADADAKAKADADAKAKADADAKAKADAEQGKAVTRGEVTQIVADAVTAAVTAAFEAQAKKQAGDDGKDDKGGDKGEGKGEDKDGQQAVLRSLTAISEGMKAVAETVKGVSESQSKIVERIEKVEGATTVRSDNKDGKTSSQGKPDVFTGIFAGNRKQAS